VLGLLTVNIAAFNHDERDSDRYHRDRDRRSDSSAD
jgi:hypothetical protein